jgi:hypothetical protein
VATRYEKSLWDFPPEGKASAVHIICFASAIHSGMSRHGKTAVVRQRLSNLAMTNL